MLFNKNMFLGLAVITAISANAFAASSAAKPKLDTSKEKETRVETKTNKSNVVVDSKVSALLANKNSISPVILALRTNLVLASKLNADIITRLEADSFKSSEAAKLINSGKFDTSDVAQLRALAGGTAILAYANEKVAAVDLIGERDRYMDDKAVFDIYSKLLNRQAAAFGEAASGKQVITQKQAKVVALASLLLEKRTGEAKLLKYADLMKSENDALRKEAEELEKKVDECVAG